LTSADSSGSAISTELVYVLVAIGAAVVFGGGLVAVAYFTRENDRFGMNASFRRMKSAVQKSSLAGLDSFNAGARSFRARAIGVKQVQPDNFDQLPRIM
jgi:hypothetical protein